MKTIGILGGMGWPSTADYYKTLNELVQARLGKSHGARIALVSLDFQEIEECQAAGGWERASALLVTAARQVERAGADFLLIASNTMHKVAPAVAAGVGIDVLHIADAVAARLVADGVRRVGLLGTKFTMEHPFYRDALARHGLEVLVPGAAERRQIHRFTYEELVKGRFTAEARAAFTGTAAALALQGAEAVLLGCTEFPLLMRGVTVAVPLYDSSALHCEAAVARALAGAPLAGAQGV